jgi:hypothetical protein
LDFLKGEDAAAGTCCLLFAFLLLGAMVDDDVKDNDFYL